MPQASDIVVNIGSCNGFHLLDVKPLPEPMVTIVS